ncbi:thiamine/thiamine pyrophosphate ABC transporter permease ThiP [Rhodobacterales bacterium 52_120_T64]|nr:thiamine/thiamine pyrophosphate ABC transporter permease ThiP [Rhodobacterales bacterium 52_120_T64]
MANRPQPINPITRVSGSAALLFVALLVIGPLIALWLRADTSSTLVSADWAAVRFTLFQATLSASISVILAIPVARALARRTFRGRSVLVTLLGAPFLLPVIVAIFGLLAIWGRSGFVSQIFQSVGAERLNIYGLTGVLLAHVFFNLPLVTRLILQGWGRIPVEHFRLSAQLGLAPKDVFLQLEVPMLRGILPGAFLLVFLLCVTSFAVALTLGGGPKATTVELAIYQALRFEFDLGKAAILGLLQFLICGFIAFWSLRATTPVAFGGGLSTATQRWDVSSKFMLLQDAIVLIAITGFLGAPLIAVIGRGLPALSNLPTAIWPAMLNSLTVALLSAVLSVLLALTLAGFIDSLKVRHNKMSSVIEGIGLLTLAVSPFVLGTGLFIIIHPIADPFALALPVTALVNAAISLPLALRALLPALQHNRLTYGRLTDSLDIQGWARFRLTTWPIIRKPLGFSTGLAAALSMGDLGVITLFAPPDVETLPLIMYRLMGAYRMDEAASVALMLVALTLTLFWLFDRGGRLGHQT